jgi:transposase
MNKEQMIQLREKVKLYAGQGMKNTSIAKKLNVSRDFVIKWKNKKDIKEDNRGWEKGRKRKFTNKQERQVIKKRKELESGFFSGQPR